MNTIINAANLIVDFFEAENISITNVSFLPDIYYWAARIPSLDPYSLAAIVIANPSKDLKFTEDEIRQFRLFYFPKDNYYERILF